MREKLERYGQWTYRGAWAIEIVAALLGLTTGVALGWQGYTASETGTALDFVLQSAPFFMVALAELTKIPIATLLFAAPTIYKPILLVFLLGLAFITFETVFTGLERAAALRQLKYEELDDHRTVRTAELTRQEEFIDRSGQSDEAERAQAQYDRLSHQRERERATILSELDRLQDQQAMSPVLQQRIKQLQERLDAQQQELDRTIDRRDNEMAREREAFENQRESYVTRIESARAAGDTAYAQLMQNELARLPNPVPPIRQRYSQEIERQEVIVNDLRSQIAEAFESAPPSENDETSNRRQELNEALRVSDQQWQERLEVAGNQLAAAQAQEANRSASLAEAYNRTIELRSEINAIEQERVPLARTDQVRRIASRFYGENPEDLSGEQADFVAVIWFGSLAALAALTGPLTAMVALGLQRIAEPNQKRESKLSRTLRNLLINWRYRRTKTVTVEKPVERVIKEFVYVPLLTDDPNELLKTLKEKLPAEVNEKIEEKLAKKPRTSRSETKRSVVNSSD